MTDSNNDSANLRLGSLSLLLACLMIIGTQLSGSPRIDATWIQGDERHFIANNPDVTGAGQSIPRSQQYLAIFTHTHGDLYQPLPILAYALEWDAWGKNRVTYMRFTDVLIHTANGFLLWAVLVSLLRLFVPDSPLLARFLIGYALALIWTLHPINVSAYAADMGRTHLLSAFFLLLSLLAHLSTLRKPSLFTSLLMLIALLAANLSKPIVGWVCVVVLLEANSNGWAKALRSWRVWGTGIIGLTFAALTLTATHEEQMLESLNTMVFGDRFSRSFFSVWLHLYNTTWPMQLSVWYLPDARAVWEHPLVWLGAGITILSLLALAITLIQHRFGLATGITWFWIVILPVLGLVGARVAAANDRYVYVPLMGAMLLVAIGLAHAARTKLKTTLASTLIMSGILSLMFLPLNVWLTDTARSSIERANRTVSVYPDQFRAQEALAMAYDFSVGHDTIELQVAGAQALKQRAREALDQTVLLAEAGPEQFATPHDKAAFHRRMAIRYLVHQAAETAHLHAQQAATIEPNALGTLTAIAQTSRAIQDWASAAAAYAALESQTGASDPFRTLRLIEFADLLLHRLSQPAQALSRFRQALEDSTLEPAERQVALRGLALAEIRAGLGANGFAILNELLQANPNDAALHLILGEYHLRSHHFEDALQTYGRLVTSDPTNQKALRGLHAAAAELNEYEVAVNAWTLAVQADPRNRAARSFLVWALACADAPKAEAACQELLSADANNPLAAYGLMLIALRTENWEQAADWLDVAFDGRAITEARSAVRAATTLERLTRRGGISAIGYLYASAIWKSQGVTARMDAALTCYLNTTKPDKSEQGLNEEVTAILERLRLLKNASESLATFDSNSSNCY